MYVDYADADENANGGTLIDALIVRALLAEDVGDKTEAEQLWKAVLAKPKASDIQRQFANDHLRSISAH
jgi:hypothetical protein